MNFLDTIENEQLSQLIRVVILLSVGIPLVWMLSSYVGRVGRKRVSDHYGQLFKKLILYSGIVLIAATAMSELGFKIGAMLSAAGIAGIAIGFAAQTSLSNIISGIFLLAETPFSTGDLIRVGDKTGVVMSIDLLSVKLRTLDNLFLRIPNETLVKNEVTNVTRFPIRRMDLVIEVAYKEDPDHVIRVLKEIANDNVYSLDEPEPMLFFSDFGESAIQFKFGVWFEKSNFLNLRGSLMKEIKNRFDREGIEIPFPHRTLYMGEASKPFDVRVVKGE